MHQILTNQKTGAILIVLVVSFLILFSVGFASGSQGPETNGNLESKAFVVSPPVILVSSIEYLENNPGIFQISNNITVISGEGIVTIADSSNGHSIVVLNTSSQSYSNQYKLIYSQYQSSNYNITTLLLNSNNGFYYDITNYLNQTTGVFHISVINEVNSTMSIVDYQTFALARIYYQSGSDPIPPPPNGGYDIWTAFNHTYVVAQGNEVFQEWENVTIYWYESSTGNAVFIKSWLNNTVEASAVYTNSFGQIYGLSEAHLDLYLGVIDYGHGLPLSDSNYSVPVGGPAYYWYFFTWNTFETQNNPIGHNIWENDSLSYGEGLASPDLPSAEIHVPSNDL
jgi:hypothetical protein